MTQDKPLTRSEDTGDRLLTQREPADMLGVNERTLLERMRCYRRGAQFIRAVR
jgi:hypothetical protein